MESFASARSVVAFGVDASHGYERTHLSSLTNIAQLLVAYAHSNLVYHKQGTMGTIKDFPKTRKTDLSYTQSEQTESLSQVPPRTKEE